MQTPHSGDNIQKAVACALAAHFLFFVMSACAKVLSETHHVAEIAFYRNALILIPFMVFLYAKGKTDLFKTKRPKLIALRAIVGSIGLIISYSAIARLPMSYVTVLFFTSTLLTPVFAFFFLKEYIGIHRWSAVFIGMLGVVIIAQPSGDLNMLGLILALLAAATHASMFVTLRQLKTESPYTVTFYFILVGAVLPGFLMPWIAHTPTYSELWIFILVAASGGIAQLFMTYSYKYAPASFITPFSYSALLWTILADIFVWRYDIEFDAVLGGAALIIAAQLYILYRETLHKRKTLRRV